MSSDDAAERTMVHSAEPTEMMRSQNRHKYEREIISRSRDTWARPQRR